MHPRREPFFTKEPCGVPKVFRLRPTQNMLMVGWSCCGFKKQKARVCQGRKLLATMSGRHLVYHPTLRPSYFSRVLALCHTWLRIQGTSVCNVCCDDGHVQAAGDWDAPVAKYLAEQKRYVLVFHYQEIVRDVIGYADRGWGSDLDDRKCISCTVLTLGSHE